MTRFILEIFISNELKFYFYVFLGKFETFLIKFSLNSKDDPKSSFLEVNVSFVCESKVGFSI